ncbi:hypothetical protein PGTUg99_001139 [Puccinia graminis f. sp. tritici]|uniref:Uncharacterized protein n=1 Tax=Puccinia graminis f. sp. tritici TaxID=56615 RepID=A0A5B0NGR4_PUCGR|nr:hypothetical protein PGTUg99_001139 [Puccinia graminis f. sp. tritici]
MTAAGPIFLPDTTKKPPRHPVLPIPYKIHKAKSPPSRAWNQPLASLHAPCDAAGAELFRPYNHVSMMSTEEVALSVKEPANYAILDSAKNFRVELQIIRRLVRTHNQIRRARARIIHRPGLNSTTYLTEVLLRRIQAEVRRLERRVYDLAPDELIEIYDP